MRVLGIETSCDETAAAIVADGREVLADVVKSQVDLHREYRGVVPEIASRSHLEVLLPVVREALARASMQPHDVDLVAVTNRPGLVGALIVGVATAKAFALAAGKPIVGVDHVAAHAYAAWMDEGSPPPLPFIALIVSGGHTVLYRHDDPFTSTEIGSTCDDAAGEAFDKVAALLQLGYPGGPIIDRLAKEGDPRRFAFKPPLANPRDPDDLDFSFSGLKTAVRYKITGENSRDATPTPLDEKNVRDLAASFQEAAVDGLVSATLRAAERSNARAVVLGGGCAANSRLRARLADACAERGLVVKLPRMNRCTDNAAMIAGLGFHEFRRRGADALDLDAVPTGSDGATP